MRLDKFRETVRLIKERDPDVIIQISTGGRAPPVQFEGVDVGEWRMDPLNLMPEMASYTPGSVSLGDPNPDPNPYPYPNPNQEEADAAEACAQHEAAYLEHAALATQAASHT